MAQEIIWSPTAMSDLEGICARIGRDSPVYASYFTERVVCLVEQLRRFPRVGRVVPEYGNPDPRGVLHQNYRIVCRLREDSVEIVAVRHGARKLGSL